ncbi:NDR1/HIN1-like protein 10 [Prosopis cineraria]|uniref:NDR1/HIN1-like protein 10 n=1 Tax=Prosopis cineraria TaxID=364024 RepID=UPI002410564B|nr:NDR1/HIN1-like protein 10 [Prosopis cineraria]
MAAKHSQLNGAYYGPSIPPPTSYHRPGRRVHFGLCSCIFNLLLTIVVVVGLAVFLFWLIVRPNAVKFHVTDASLTQFNYTSNNTLFYNLSLNITARNPNRRLGLYYDKIRASASYQDAWFDSQTLTPFYQGHKTTDFLNPVFVGQRFLLLDSTQASELSKDQSSGLYDIDVTLHLKIRFKLGALKTFKLKPKVKCDLSSLPLTPTSTPDGGSSAGGFQIKRCDLDY